jgi:hypothetical protein
MALPFDDFFRRMTGQPMALPGATMAGNGPVNAPSPNAATVAQPSLEQLQSQDYQRAAMQRMGQLGMLLMAAGQRMTPKERATILAQAPQFMDGMQTDVANAAQARLMGARAQQEQADMARSEATRAKLSDPQFLQSLGVTPQVAEVLGEAGLRKLIENQAMANTPDAIQDRRLKDAQIQHYLNPQKVSDTYTDTMNRERAQFDARLSQAKELGLTGDDATQYAATGKIQTGNEKQTQDQANAALFSARMEEANKVISNPDISKYAMGVRGTMNRANAAIPIIGNAALDPQYQQFDQARRDFINAIMRRESGAKIDDTEFDNANKQYFPQVGDSPEVLAQKAANRATAIQGIYDASAPQYRRQHQVDTTGGRNSPYKEYPNARQAPDGHWYVQQDGKTYRVDN